MKNPPAFIADITLDELDNDPYPIYQRLRREAPVAYIPAAGAWFVTRYEDCEAVGTGMYGFVGAKDHPTMDRVFGTPNVLSAEGDTHKELRTGVDPKLQPRPVMDVVESVVRPIAKHYIDRMAGRGHGEIMEDYMEPVSVEALRHVMGLDDLVSADVLRRWFHDLNKGNANLGKDPELFKLSDATNIEIEAVLRPKLEYLVAHPDESMLSHMLWKGRTAEQGHRPFRMIMPSVRVILLGGMQEPGHAAGSTLMGLFTRPDQWARVQESPAELIAPAVNEGLRWIAPIGVVDRQSPQDVQLGGQLIPAGSLVEVVMASANRDESKFDDPDRYDLDRAARAHHAFGYGQHFCAGHFFARRVEQIIFEEIARGLPNLRPVPDTVPKVTGWVFRAPKHFPVEWDRIERCESLVTSLSTAEKPASSIVAEPPAGQQTMLLRVRSLERLADDVMGVVLEDGAGNPLPAWEAGAHINLWMKPDKATSYSLCGDPADRRHYAIGVHLAADSSGASRLVHETVRPGMMIHVSGPSNNFRLQPSKRYMFIAGGIGITPIVTMMEAAKAQGVASELVYCGRKRSAMAFLDRVEAAGAVSIYAGDERRRADLGQVVAHAAAQGATIYVCGPTRMLDAIEQHAELLNVPVVWESFEEGLAHRDDDFAFDVVLARSGKRVPVAKGQTILEALTQAGYHVRQSCRAGNCGSCETAIVEGEADHRDVLLTPKQRAENKRLMVCVSRAKHSDAPLTLDVAE